MGLFSGKDRGYFAPGRGTFHGWKVPKDPRVVVLTKSAALRTPRCGHPSLRSLARPLPTTTTTLGRGWVPGGSAPYDFRTQGTRLENGLNLFGAGMNLGPLRPPPAAARAGQIRRSFFSHIAPLVHLAFPASVASFLAPCSARCPIGPIRQGQSPCPTELQQQTQWGPHKSPATAGFVGRGRARERSEECPPLGVPSGVYFARTM